MLTRNTHRLQMAAYTKFFLRLKMICSIYYKKYIYIKLTLEQFWREVEWYIGKCQEHWAYSHLQTAVWHNWMLWKKLEIRSEWKQIMAVLSKMLCWENFFPSYFFLTILDQIHDAIGLGFTLISADIRLNTDVDVNWSDQGKYFIIFYMQIFNC